VLHHPIHQYNPYRAISENNFPADQHITREVINVYENAANQKNEESERNKKNFVWSKNTS
jgi:hypothetical protein